MESTERVAILISGFGKEKLLGITKVSREIGEAITSMCLNLIKEGTQVRRGSAGTVI